MRLSKTKWLYVSNHANLDYNREFLSLITDEEHILGKSYFR